MEKKILPLSAIRNAKEVYVTINGRNDEYSVKVTKAEGRNLIKNAGTDIQATVYEDGKVVTLHSPI